MRFPSDSDAWPWLAVAACFGGAFTLACLLTASAPPLSDDTEGVASLLFGGSRSALSANFYDQADAFFHRGVEHKQRRAPINDWIQKLQADINPTAHRHADGRDSAEIIPWLKLATGADPHNVDAWLVSAFWLETGIQRPDLAGELLREAQRHNPRDHRILLERGRQHLRAGQFEAAADMLDAALTRWPGNQDPEDLQTRLDRAEILTYSAFLLEMAGRPDQAVTAFKNVLALFPERSYIRERARVLETGLVPDETARALLERQVKHRTLSTCNEDTKHRD